MAHKFTVNLIKFTAEAKFQQLDQNDDYRIHERNGD